MLKVQDRFLKYVKFDTKSDENTGVTPSTKGQLVLASELGKELKQIGMQNVLVNDLGYVMGELASNIEKNVPKIGFIAHMDTSPEMRGENINPKIVKNYNGEDIILNEDKNIILSPKDSPELLNYKGKDIITTDGATLLGADDKAGIAEIITAMEYLINHPELKHGDIKVCFTPDEEIGEGADNFDVKRFNADYAYTVDGGAIGELEYENFNAAGVEVKINGRNVHPGDAKNKMINSMSIANEFMSMLPQGEVPSQTEGYEGFYHLCSMSGCVEETKLSYIIRDFDRESFESRKITFKNIADKLNNKYNEDTVLLEIKDQYYNMKEKIVPVKHIVDIATKAMEEVDVKPNIVPIRGGTDGARLSFEGLPTPNLFTGGHNFHGRFEFIPIFAMEKSVEVILKIIELYTK